MKKIIKSWRWSRLTKRSTWNFFVENYLLGTIFIFSLYAAFLVILYNSAVNMLALGFVPTAIIVTFFAWEISKLCTADDYYELTDENNNLCRIYIYEDGLNSFKILAKHSDRKIWFKASEYKTSSEEEKYSFLYKDIDTEVWRMITAWNSHHEELGKKISNQVFKLDEDNLVILQPFRQGLFLPIKSNEFYWGNKVFIPKKSRENLLQLNDDFIGPTKCTDKPDKYLFMKHGDKYMLYGFYLNSDEDMEPLVIPLLAETVIVCNDYFKYVFVAKDDTYVAIKRENNYCRVANDIFFVHLHYTGSKVDVRQYDEDTQSFQSKAICLLDSVDFDNGEFTGKVVGEKSLTRLSVTFDEDTDAKFENQD